MLYTLPQLTDDEIIAVRRASSAKSTAPWSDTLAFAEGLMNALAAKMAASAESVARDEAPVDWETLAGLGWQQVQCPACGDLARAAPDPSGQMQRNSMRYLHLRKLVRGERTPDGQAFDFSALQPDGDLMRGAVCQHLDAALDARMDRGVVAAQEEVQA